MTAPERIWMFKANIPKNLITMGDTEYVCADLHDATERKLAKAVEALKWYAEQARLCRLIHSEGDSGRHALQADGGKKARAVLAEIEKGEPK